MRTLITKLYILCILSVVLLACEKEGEVAVMKQSSPTTLTATPSAVVLDKTKATDTVLTVTSTLANFGYQAGVKYTLQLAKKGTDFTAPKNIELGSVPLKKYTVSELNALLGQINLSPGQAGEVDLRIKSQVSSLVTPVYSNVVTITATSYADIIEYPSLYVPGAYQDWKPASADKVSSVKDDKTYEGYINFTDATKLAFKFTSNPDWDHTNYGGAGAGKLSATGGDLTVPEIGYYLFKADLNTMTWSATKTTWGVIGDATGSWDNDTDLTYDPTAKVWKITLDLEGGKNIKFRANRDPNWTINLGDNKPANGLLKYGGENIPITESGKYEIALNLSIPGNYSYTLKKI